MPAVIGISAWAVSMISCVLAEGDSVAISTDNKGASKILPVSARSDK